MSFVGDVWDDLTGKTAAEEAASASQSASQAQLGYQQDALDFSKDVFDWQKGIYEEDRERQLGYLDQLSDPAGIIESAQASPLYQQQLQSAEDAVLRSASATGGLRGGQSIGNLADVQQSALSNAYAQEMNRLSGLAGLSPMQAQPTGSGVTGLMQNIGQTASQGIIGAQQSAQAAQQAQIGNLFGLGQLGIGATMAFSDERLKEDIEPIGYENGIPTFSWTWNKAAEKLGLKGKGFGTLSKYAKQVNPHSVQVENGYEKVNYDMLGVSHG